MNLTPLFQPKTMVVVGVSQNNERHPANVIYNKNNLRQAVKVFAVNYRGGLFQGETIYRALGEIPRKVDLAVIATRAEFVPQVMEDCIRGEVGGAIVVSGGFAESGRRDLQEKITDMAREANFPFIGPNCLGVYAPPVVDTFFIPSERIVKPDPGKVALVSQSGGVLVDHLIRFSSEGVGLSLAVSIGNKALIREIDLLKYFAEDPATGVVAFYIEGFGENEGRDFVLTAMDCPKPVIVLKAGRSQGGQRAVTSHTASMAGDYEVFSSVLDQYGILEARSEAELISLCEVLSCYQKAAGSRVAIISGSGGHGALAVDICAAHALEVPPFSESTQQSIRALAAEQIRNIASFKNPIDLTGSAVDDDFVGMARYLSRQPDIDCLLLLLLPYLPGISSDLGARLSLVYRQEGKPMIAYVPHVEKYRMLIEGFQLNSIPVAHSIEEAVQMARGLRRSQPC
ncbi:MAG: CoA-binding protein [Deltaproteobacteria bacterium]|nr:CoA-binding protein [Deltaproteobacteria bacterium]